MDITSETLKRADCVQKMAVIPLWVMWYWHSEPRLRNLYHWPNIFRPFCTQLALGWCRACSQHSTAIEPPRFFPGHVMVTANWHASSTMKLFFSAILLITLRVSLVDWNSSERALHAFPSLSLSVCIVSLKIAIFLVKTHNCQRMSCVCVHKASSIVRFP